MSGMLMAHRGASAAAPENTLAAFRLAVELGAPMIELDVQLTVDGNLVVLHDATIDRTSDGTGAVADLTLTELRRHRFDRLRPHAHPDEEVRIMEFSEAVDFMVRHDISLNVETKEYGPDAAGVNDLVWQALRDAGWVERTLVSSINHAAMASMKRQHPELRTAIAFMERFDDLTAYARGCRADVLHPYHRLVDEAFVARARDGEFGVNVWTVDDPVEARRVLALDIDGMMTNRPDLLNPLNGTES